MKTTSRKRLLISSVAMLLVAMLALGTATFAWFTQNTQAKADELSVQTVKASELKLSDDTNDWTDQLHYNAVDEVLKPASSADGVHWYTAVAAKKDAFTASATPTTPLTNLDGYVFKNQLNVANMGGSAVNGVKIKFTLSETPSKPGKTYLRLALVEVDKKGKDATITGNFKDGVYAVGADTANAFTPDAGGTAVTTEKVDAKAGTSVEFSVGNLGAAGSGTDAKYYNLYLWYEGQDVDCSDYNAGNTMPKITFTVTGDTASMN